MNRSGGLAMSAVSALVVVAVALVSMMSLWTERSLEFWLTRLKGEAVDVPYWMAVVFTVALNAIVLGLNICSEIARLFVS